MTARPLPTLLRSLKACGDARKWAEPYDTLQAAWDACPRGDWMIWLLEAANVHAPERRTFAYACADRAVRVHVVAALRSAGLTAKADTLAALAPVTDKETADAAHWAAHWAAGSAHLAALSAHSAAGSAFSAARSAAYSASVSAAYSAAFLAFSTADSASYSSAESAERQWQADALRRIVPTPEVGL